MPSHTREEQIKRFQEGIEETKRLSELAKQQAASDVVAGKPQEFKTTRTDTGFTTTPITAADLTPTISPNLPSPSADTTNYSGLISGGQTTIDSLLKALAPTTTSTTPTATDEITTRLRGLLTTQQPSLTEEYKTLATQEGIETKSQEVLSKQTALQTARSKLATVNAQLAGLTAEQQAIPIRLQQEATGRGITTGGLAPIETGQLRNLALRALPLQAQALAAQAEVASAQGDVELSQNALKLAQDKLNTVFNLKTKDEENKYNYQKDLRDKIWDFVTETEKTRLFNLQKKDDREFQLYKDRIDNLQTISNNLIANGQGDLAAKVSQLDPKSKMYQQDLANLLSQAKPKSTAQSDFEQAFLRDKGRLPTVAELLEFKKSSLATTPTPGAYVPGSNPTVDNWARLIISGQAKITDVPNPKGSTMRSDVTNAIATSGQLLLSEKDREKLSTLDTAFNVYETIKELSEKINTFGVGGRVTGYLSRYIGGATQFNTDIARYNATRQGFVSNVARTLGEKGTLAEGDVARAINNLPTVNDTQAVAQGKLETLRKILQGAKDSIIQKSTEPLTGTTSGTLSPQMPGAIRPEDLRTKYNY